MGKYNEEFALNELKKWYSQLGRIPTKTDFKQYNIKPSNSFYTRKYGGVINACVLLGLIEKPLTKEERMDVSIKELREVATKLNRIPYEHEYEQFKTKGYSLYPLKIHFNMTYTEICNTYLLDFKEIIPEGFKKCSNCKTIKPLSDYGVATAEYLNVRCACKVCEYLKRNQLIIPNGWDEHDILLVIDNILNEKVQYINDLVDKLNNKTLDDITKLLSEQINIGNKPQNVKVCCEYCKKEHSKFLSVYLLNEHCFCSSDCYWKYKFEFEPKGEDHPDYNRIKVNCTNCNKEYDVTPYDFNKTNSYGDNHNFCSQECYWEYRSKYYVGEKGSMYQYQYSKKQIQAMRIRQVKRLSENPEERDTKPQIAITELLNSMGIKNEREYNCKYYSIDNYLIDSNLMIEVNGDYYHAHPSRDKLLDKIQYKNVRCDKSKHTYIKKYYGVEILYLWETDINNNLELCKSLIMEYINHKGVLFDYNSFNYELVDNQLVLKKEKITPLIYLPKKQFEKLLIDGAKEKRETYAIIQCDYCDKDIKRSKNMIKRSINHFCSRQCHIEYTRQNKKQIVCCDNCGKEYEEYIIIITNNKNHFCSKQCHINWQQTNRTR